jgi:hypothetical protein
VNDKPASGHECSETFDSDNGMFGSSLDASSLRVIADQKAEIEADYAYGNDYSEY